MADNKRPLIYYDCAASGQLRLYLFGEPLRPPAGQSIGQGRASGTRAAAPCSRQASDEQPAITAMISDNLICRVPLVPRRPNSLRLSCWVKREARSADR
ncbi:MAG: hypothetical protein DRI90_25385 [Deltaproteobacteria bacterium]|nr:MAG: hypothetical protein DRI90_25385 [Deltaproteobacteria bacterium]